MFNILSYTSRAGYARQTKPLENCVLWKLSTQKLCVVQADKLARFSHLSTWHRILSSFLTPRIKKTWDSASVSQLLGESSNSSFCCNLYQFHSVPAHKIYCYLLNREGMYAPLSLSSLLPTACSPAVHRQPGCLEICLQ